VVIVKKIAFLLLIAICFLCFTCKKERTASVYGVVSDSKTHEPIEGVTVSISSGVDWVITESDGYYEFNNINLRNNTMDFIISVICMGYKTKEVEVTLLRNDRKEVNIEMTGY